MHKRIRLAYMLSALGSSFNYSLVINLKFGRFGVTINPTQVRKPMHANHLAFSDVLARVARPLYGRPLLFPSSASTHAARGLLFV